MEGKGRLNVYLVRGVAAIYTHRPHRFRRVRGLRVKEG